MHEALGHIFRKYQDQFSQVVKFKPHNDHIAALDLSSANPAMHEEVYRNMDGFSTYIASQLKQDHAKFGIGGYLEKRDLYKRSALFETLRQSKKTFDRIYTSAIEADEPVATDTGMQRSIHLGMDIWGAEGTPVHAPIGGSVHSFAFNNQFGDYGATIILQHQLDGTVFHTLYGHLSKADLKVKENEYVAVGECIGHFGPAEENGYWPPHLHFQVIIDMEMKMGDYPGVCHPDDVPFYQKNCPDPDMILNLNTWARPNA